MRTNQAIADSYPALKKLGFLVGLRAVPFVQQLEWTDLLEPTTQRFKPADDLKKLFADAGIVLDKPSATHCQSGGRASVMAFGMELMGAKDLRNYYRSWGEWGNADDTPIVPGKPKEKK